MKRFKVIITAISMFFGHVIITNNVTGAEGLKENMGYCFDAAFHKKTSRLYVAGGSMGTHVFELQKGKLHFITTMLDGGYHRNLKISGDRAFVANTDRGLVIYDITEKIPVCTWEQQDKDVSGLGIYVHDNHAYLAGGKEGLYIFDVSKPDTTERVSICKTNGDAWDVWVNDGYAYVADLQKGVTVIDVKQPSQPQKVSCVTWDANEPMAEIIRGEGKTAYIASGKHGLVVLDISNPLNPQVVSTYKSDQGSFGEGLCVRNALVYLANGNNENKDENGLIIIDAQNPHSLNVRGKCTFSGWVEGVCMADHHVFVANTSSGVRSIDVSDPNNPCLVDSVGFVKKKDPLLESEMSLEEAQAIEEFYIIRKEILAGRKYEDASTPLRVFLSVISAVHFRDAETLQRVLAMDFAKMNQKITNEFMVDWEKSLMEHDIFRAPLAPEQPEEGTCWPIYMKHKNGTELVDTYIPVFWKGKWMYVGNLGNSGNWRGVVSSFQGLLKKYGK